MASPLTGSACSKLYFLEPPPESGSFTPILQVLSVKKINTQKGAATDRYRVILSDGEYYLQSMLATALNVLVEDETIQKHSLIRLTAFGTNVVADKRLIIILSADPLPYDSLEKIGSPESVDKLPNGSAAVNGGAPKPLAVSVPAQGAAPGARGGAAPRGGAARGGAAAGRGGGRMGAGGGPPGALYPIEGLSPYQNKWTIKARVTNRSEIKHWSNQRGEGKLFSVTLMDETGEIRATGFNEAVDNFYDMLQEGKVFFISRARINIAKKQFSNVNNEYEITFESHTEIEPVDDNDTDVPQIKFTFTPVQELGNIPKDGVCDVLAVVKEVFDLSSINSKATQKPVSKRDLTLVDSTGHSVRLTLWGKQAENWNHEGQPVVAFKGVKVSDFNRRSLSMFSGSSMSVHPDVNEAHALRGWYDASGDSTNFIPFSNAGGGMGASGAGGVARPEELKTLGQVKDENLGMDDKPAYFTTKAVINFVKNETFCYPACSSDNCSKKVVQDANGWRCEKCDVVHVAPLYRYILNMNILDHSGHVWITAFNELAEQLLGQTANELMAIKESDELLFEGAFRKPMGKPLQFSCSAKQDSWNDQVRVRYSARTASTLDFKAESHSLVKKIDAL